MLSMLCFRFGILSLYSQLRDLMEYADQTKNTDLIEVWNQNKEVTYWFFVLFQDNHKIS